MDHNNPSSSFKGDLTNLLLEDTPSKRPNTNNLYANYPSNSNSNTNSYLYSSQPNQQQG